MIDVIFIKTVLKSICAVGRIHLKQILPLVLVMAVSGLTAFADVSLPAIISDHAVLPRSQKTAIWGKAEPGEAVSISLGGLKSQTAAGADGKWKLDFDLSNTGAGPFELLVQGKNLITVKDVVVGDIWLCCGQSNMAFTLRYSLGSKEEIARSANPFLRHFSVKHNIAETPRDSLEGTWIVASPETSGGFTALGYYFGATLQRELKIPIGLINASYNGSSVVSWTSQSSLEADDIKERTTYLSLPKRFKEHLERYHDWETKYERKDSPSTDPQLFADPKLDTSSWTEVKMPGPVSAPGLPDAGAVWLRHVVKVEAGQANKPLRICFEELRFGTVYWDGVKIDEMTPDTFRKAVSWQPPWTIMVPEKLVHGGESVLALRLFSPDKVANLKFSPAKIPLLTGVWLAKSEYSFPPLSAAAKKEYPGIPPVKDFQDFFTPSSLFDGMIHPLVPCKIKGVIWYQGEANTHNAAYYRTHFPSLIKDWRSYWGSELPFYFCQLPNQGIKDVVPSESKWAELREAQVMALALPYTGQAVLLDTADAALHPSNKKDPGERLALIAIAKTYGRSVVYSGPVYSSMRIDGDKARIKFLNADGGLIAKPLPSVHVLKYASVSPDVPVTAPLVLPSPGSKVQGFAICGEDRIWKWADAKIEGPDEVVVWNPEISKPVAVRYAWADNPTCNLFNASGLPASPFRTDVFSTSVKK
ncbi:MAG: sialate O-acetylesterase [Victivallales bacterium]